MGATSQGGTDLIAVHIAQADPRTAPPIRVASDRLGRRHERPSRFADTSIDWEGHGFQPRWLGMESSDCAAALDPSIFHSRGATELERFAAGARSRDEVAIVVAMIGDADAEVIHSPFGDGASVLLPRVEGSIGGARLPAMTKPTLAGGVHGADRDLGLRLLNRPDHAPWWSLGVRGTTAEPSTGPPETRHPSGRLEPILVDSLGTPVAAVWVPDSEDQRWYVIPDATDPNAVLDWLSSQALPQYVPGALRRARSPHAVQPSLQTPAEERARRELAKLHTNYERDRERLATDLRLAINDAEPVRQGLLYGTGADLVNAVATVLRAAGLVVTNLDELLGDTSSADLLVSDGRGRRLVEVKSAGGNAAEKLVAALERHLQTWSAIRPREPVDGGVLVVNHQHKLDPDERTTEVFSRKEFVATLSVPVLSSRQLFDWWRVGDWGSIQIAVMTTPSSQSSSAVGRESEPRSTSPEER